MSQAAIVVSSRRGNAREEGVAKGSAALAALSLAVLLLVGAFPALLSALRVVVQDVFDLRTQS